jgi:hypothetical protein
MAADRAASNDIAKRMAESKARMVQAAQDVAKAICNQGNEATSSKPNMRALQLREKELDVKKKEIKVAQQELVANQQKKQAGAFKQASMMQEFLKLGLGYDQAMKATITWLGPQIEMADPDGPSSSSQGQGNQEGGSQRVESDAHDLD